MEAYKLAMAVDSGQARGHQLSAMKNVDENQQIHVQELGIYGLSLLSGAVAEDVVAKMW